MGMSDKIEAFILELMRHDEAEWLKLQRNELAQLFGCVPSQINYVISTRFSPDKGYIVQSRRGGGGCVLIKKAQPVNKITADDADRYIKKLLGEGYITAREAAIIREVSTDDVLGDGADEIRARMIDALMKF